MILWPAREIINKSRQNAMKTFKRHRVLICRLCGSKFRTVPQLGAHVSNHHRGEDYHATPFR